MDLGGRLQTSQIESKGLEGEGARLERAPTHTQPDETYIKAVNRFPFHLYIHFSFFTLKRLKRSHISLWLIFSDGEMVVGRKSDTAVSWSRRRRRCGSRQKSPFFLNFFVLSFCFHSLYSILNTNFLRNSQSHLDLHNNNEKEKKLPFFFLFSSLIRILPERCWSLGQFVALADDSDGDGCNLFVPGAGLDVGWRFEWPYVGWI